MIGIKWIVKPDKKLVVGSIERLDCQTIYDELCDRLPKKLRNNFLGYLLQVPDIHHREKWFVSKAIAQETDEFDEKTGKKIVKTKLFYKYHATMRRRYCVMISQLRELLRHVEDLENEHYVAANKYDQQLKKYM